MNASGRPRESGFTIVEILLGLGIGTLALMAASTALLTLQSRSLQIALSQARSEIIFNVRQTSWEPRALQQTIQKNPNIQKCFPATISWTTPVPAGNSSPPDCPSNTTFGVTLYDNNGLALSGPGIDAAGNPARPAYYTSIGGPCTLAPGGGSNCAFAVTTTFETLGQPCWSCNQALVALPYPNLETGYQPSLLYNPNQHNYPWEANGVLPESFYIHYNIHYCAADSVAPCGPNSLKVPYFDVSGTVAMTVLDAVFTTVPPR